MDSTNTHRPNRVHNGSQQRVLEAAAAGSISNADVRALLGMNAQSAGSRICGMVDAGLLAHVPGTLQPMRWQITDAGRQRMDKPGNLLALRQLSAQLRCKIQRISAHQGLERQQRAEDRRAALASVALAARQAREQQRAEKQRQREANAAARRQAAEVAGKRPRGRPAKASTPVPGAQQLVAAVAGNAPTVRLAREGGRLIDAHALLQDPLGLLARASVPADQAPTSATQLQQCATSPRGPYIRPDGLAHLALPSRRVEGLVPHSSPLTQA